MRLRVLGPLELAAEDGTGPGLSGKLRRLLAALTVRANAVASIDWLAEIVWADDPPVNAEAAMHNLVSRLRTALRVNALRAGGADGPTLLTRPPGYLLQIASAELDSACFEKLAGAARAALAEAPARSATGLDEALQLWRGAAYAEYADEAFARPEATRLTEARTSAQEDRVEAALALGQHDDAIRRLEPLVAEHPLRERPHAQLMLALYRAGRQADALATYRRYRDRLDEELGLEPSTDLALLETQILRHEVAVPATPLVPAVGQARLGNLPAALPPLVGRAETLDRIAASLETARVVTLTGAGGIGKTSLAVRAAVDAADRYPDGGWLLELSTVLDPGAVAAALGTMLSVPQRQGRSVPERLVEFLRPKRLLLVLDNCEHLVAEVARLVDVLIRGCPDLTVLATSREPLGVPRERVFPIPTLPVPPPNAEDAAVVRQAPSVALFLDRAAEADPDFGLTAGNAAAVAEICRRLDGLPLAIELAAPRMRSMTPAEVVDRLSERFHFLRSSQRIAAERHRTLRAVIDWSYELLDERERGMFSRLSVFAGAFSWAAAHHVAEDFESQARFGDVLSALVDRSMLVATRAEDQTTRYSLLETMRAYGQERLAERGDTEPGQRRHAQFYVDAVEEAAAGLGGPRCQYWADAIDRGFADLRLAHAWALDHEPELAARLVAALVDYNELRMQPEVSAWAERTLDVAPAGSASLPAVWAVAAGGARFFGDLERAIALAGSGLAAAPDPDNAARRFPLYILGEVAVFQGRLDDADRLGAELATLAERSGDDLRVGLAACTRALARAYAGDTVGARHIVATGSWAGPVLRAWARYVDGEIGIDADPESSIIAIEEALYQARVVGDHYLTGVALVSAASLRGRHGDPLQAVPLFRDALDHWRCAGNWTHQWTTVRNVVELLSRLDAAGDATVLLGALANRSTAAPVFGPDEQRLARIRDALAERLGTASYDQAAARGMAMSDDEVVDWARSALDRTVTRTETPVPARAGSGSRPSRGRESTA